ncbi:MAG: ABC transporter permease [gamma proteobacterium symbiont of Bathyaustriella thionipta]|nr:ABC transporter permease [gamma proteobacterium symbiont of Bathyaustriella thionipta]
MVTDTPRKQTTEEKLPPAAEVFKWPYEAASKNNWSETARRWAVLRKAYPDHPGTWFQAITAHIEANELEHAEKLLERALKQFPKQPNTQLYFAALCMRKEKWESAEKYLEQSRELYPDDVQTWVKSSICAEHRNNLKQAEAYHHKACEISPDHQYLHIQHAEFAMRNEQWENALKLWEKIRNKFQEIPAGYHRAAEAARNLGRNKEARQLLLAHEYVPDFLNSEANQKHTEEKQRKQKNLVRLLELIWIKAIFNLRSEVHRNYLSYGWWILEPLLHMSVYYLVFGVLLQRGGENYPVFLLTGLIPWMWFMKAISSSSNSIIAGQNLILQVGLPSAVFPLVSLLQTTLKQIPVFIILFGLLWLQGMTPTMHWWALAPVIIVQILITVAFACIVAAIIPFIRDLSILVPTGLMFLMFLSGIFYDYKTISPEWQSLFLMNPIAFLIKSYREIFIEGILPDMQVLAFWGLGSAVACALLIYAYKRLRYIYPRVLLE